LSNVITFKFFNNFFFIVLFINASDFINGAIIRVDSGAIASDGFPVVPSADSEEVVNHKPRIRFFL
jgi:hypothetical protein